MAVKKDEELFTRGGTPRIEEDREIDDAVIARIGDKMNWGNRPLGSAAAPPLATPTAQAEPPAPPAAIPPAEPAPVEETSFNLSLPVYVMDQLAEMAFKRKATKKYIIMEALRALGVQISDEDMLQDGRSSRQRKAKRGA